MRVPTQPRSPTPSAQLSLRGWFFRLSRYREQITALVTSGQLDITPIERRNEVLGFLADEVGDVSVSRPAASTRGWGIPVPGDPGQVVYVWFDALTNYLTGLGYGGSHNGDAENECHEPGGLPPGARLLTLGQQNVSEGGRLSWCTSDWT